MDVFLMFIQKYRKQLGIGVLSIISLLSFANYLQKKKVFLSFAIEDSNIRDLMIGQAENKRVPFEFIDMSLKEPFSNAWKTQCREKIKACDGVIALLSKKTRRAEGARWEIKCAIEEGIPIIGVHAHKGNKGAVPSELEGKIVIDWDWDLISKFVNSI